MEASTSNSAVGHHQVVAAGVVDPLRVHVHHPCCHTDYCHCYDLLRNSHHLFRLFPIQGHNYSVADPVAAVVAAVKREAAVAAMVPGAVKVVAAVVTVIEEQTSLLGCFVYIKLDCK